MAIEVVFEIIDLDLQMIQAAVTMLCLEPYRPTLHEFLLMSSRVILVFFIGRALERVLLRSTLTHKNSLAFTNFNVILDMQLVFPVEFLATCAFHFLFTSYPLICVSPMLSFCSLSL